MFASAALTANCARLKSVSSCTPKLRFQRLVREICEAFSQGQKRWKVTALLALQEASKYFIMEYFNDLTIIAAHVHQITVMDKDSDTVKRMRWRYNKLLQPSKFVNKKIRDLLVILLTKKVEADALKIRDVTHEVHTRAKTAYTELVDQRQKHMKHSQVLLEDTKYINETRIMNSRNLSLLRRYPYGVYMYLNMSDGELFLVLNAVDIDILWDAKAKLFNTIVYAGMKYWTLATAFYVMLWFLAKTLDNAPLFPEIGDIELMLASREAAVLKAVAWDKMEELSGMGEEADVDAPAMAEEVSTNRMEELGGMREEAEVEM
ncbi:hypothetical protein L7F22_011840 [Adiantum nelumboides]|nr:hypothetical protein [Adiantum nelumboides]